jgi:DNA-binding LacI/PurR family transcriptional regulator
LANKRASLRDVAQAAQVSVGTVSNYLNGSAPVHPTTQIRIQQAIDTLGYRPNELARSLRRSHTNTLGFILPNIANPFYTAMFDGAEQAARHSGYTLTLGITHYDNKLSNAYMNVLRSRQMDGIIIDGYGTYCAEELADEIDIPVVVIEPPLGFTGWSTVQIDDVTASQDAVEHLIERGHRQIGIICPTLEGARCQGYRRALERHGIAFDPSLVCQFYVHEPDGIMQGAQAMGQLLEQAAFTACFITADVLALGALRVLKARSLRVPEDMAIVGFDDIPFAALTDPPLTTISQLQQQMGEAAVEMLLRHIRDESWETPTHQVFEHRLIVRQSS